MSWLCLGEFRTEVADTFVRFSGELNGGKNKESRSLKFKAACVSRQESWLKQR